MEAFSTPLPRHCSLICGIFRRKVKSHSQTRGGTTHPRAEVRTSCSKRPLPTPMFCYACLSLAVLSSLVFVSVRSSHPWSNHGPPWVILHVSQLGNPNLDKIHWAGINLGCSALACTLCFRRGVSDARLRLPAPQDPGGGNEAALQPPGQQGQGGSADKSTHTVANQDATPKEGVPRGVQVVSTSSGCQLRQKMCGFLLKGFMFGSHGRIFWDAMARHFARGGANRGAGNSGAGHARGADEIARSHCSREP